MDDESERDTVLFTVCHEVAQAAIAQVASCEACNPDAAEFPFECILDRVMLFSGAGIASSRKIPLPEQIHSPAPARLCRG